MRRMLMACAVVMVSTGAYALPTDEQLEWLRANTSPLDHVQAGNGFEDLDAFARLVGDTRVVALGECTHGSREVFQMKHRLIEYMASELGFTVFSIEANLPECAPINEYVHGVDGDVEALIGGMYFSTWATEEVRSLVQWMRGFNAGQAAAGTGKSMDYTGMDMQFPDVAMRNVLAFLAEHDPDEHERVKEVYARATRAAPGGEEFASTATTLPIGQARGKTITYSAHIKTRALTGGHAGLWLRIDGPDGETLGFDNMDDTGPRGTAEWARHEIRMDVPEDAVEVVIGLICTGQGEVWFDDLAIDLGGETYDHEAWSPSFEGGDGGVFVLPPLRAYEFAVVDDEAAVGERSMRVRYNEPEPGTMTADEALEVCGAIVTDRFQAQRDALIDRAGEEAYAWAERNAVVVRQCMELRADPTYRARDRCMAENVLWLLERDPEARVVLWAHSGHNAMSDGRMGRYLNDALGDDYMSVAFATGSGTYRAAKPGEGMGEHPLMPPPEGSYDEAFALVGHDRFLLDLRTTQAGSAGSGWFHEAAPWRAIGAFAQEQQYFSAVLRDWHDAVIWIGETSAAKGM